MTIVLSIGYWVVKRILIPMGASVAFMGERVTWRVAVGTPLALLAMWLLSVG